MIQERAPFGASGGSHGAVGRRAGATGERIIRLTDARFHPKNNEYFSIDCLAFSKCLFQSWNSPHMKCFCPADEGIRDSSRGRSPRRCPRPPSRRVLSSRCVIIIIRMPKESLRSDFPFRPLFHLCGFRQSDPAHNYTNEYPVLTAAGARSFSSSRTDQKTPLEMHCVLSTPSKGESSYPVFLKSIGIGP